MNARFFPALLCATVAVGCSASSSTGAAASTSGSTSAGTGATSGGGTSGTTSGSSGVQGPPGYSFALRSAYTVYRPGPDGGNDLTRGTVVLADFGSSCADLLSGDAGTTEPFHEVEIIFRNDPAFVPGTYEDGVDTFYPDGGQQFMQAGLYIGFGDGGEDIAALPTGQLTITAVDGEHLAAQFNLNISDGAQDAGFLSGAFDAQTCVE